MPECPKKTGYRAESPEKRQDVGLRAQRKDRMLGSEPREKTGCWAESPEKRQDVGLRAQRKDRMLG